jgi:hypothetical protein
MDSNDKNTWKPVVGLEDRYEVNRIGEIRSLHPLFMHKILWQKIGKRGYTVIPLGKLGFRKEHKVHRLVAQAFLPNPQAKCCVNHKDGNKLNNNAENLEWVTNLENWQHAKSIGLIQESRKIIDTCTGLIYESMKEVAELFSINVHTLKDYLRGRIKHNPTCFEYVSK